MQTVTDVWTAVHEERRAFLELLESLTADEWDAPSLCADWRVRDVVGHCISETQIKIIPAFAQIIAAGFDMNRYISKDGRRRGAATVTTLLEGYRQSLPTRTHPPGQNEVSMLEEAVLHQIDVRQPLECPRATPPERVLPMLGKLLTDRIFPGRRLAQGLTLTATDVPWSHGEGPEVLAPVESLALVLSGRFFALDHLRGEGAPLLRSRTTTAS